MRRITRTAQSRTRDRHHHFEGSKIDATKAITSQVGRLEEKQMITPLYLKSLSVPPEHIAEMLRVEKI